MAGPSKDGPVTESKEYLMATRYTYRLFMRSITFQWFEIEAPNGSYTEQKEVWKQILHFNDLEGCTGAAILADNTEANYSGKLTTHFLDRLAKDLEFWRIKLRCED